MLNTAVMARLSWLVLLALPASIGLAQTPYKNVLIDKQGSDWFTYPPCEPSIAVGRTDQAHIVAGAILDAVYISADSGKTWTSSRLKSPLGVFGDPCIVAGPRGDFYYCHLGDPEGKGWSSSSLLDCIVCQRSKDMGRSWSKGSGAGFNHPKDQDKEWAVTSPDGKYVYMTWTQFDKYESHEPGDSSVILFSRTKRSAKKWSKAVRINTRAGDCLDGDLTTEGAVPATGPDGTIYVAWALGEDIWMDRSTDRGKTWLSQDVRVGTISGGWNQDIPGIMRANGMPVLVCDISQGPNSGNLYVCWADTRNGADDTDIFCARSTDRGTTWSEPVRVNNDIPGKQQFFPWLAIDPVTGYLYAVFYDRRNYDDLRTDVFMAVSEDGGLTWKNERISEQPFVPDPTVFFGDYTNISAVNGVVRPIWTRCDASRLSVWTALINK